tara:strand:+ start:35 stop:1429 length:1395 start_codon:yes stop_codon:yes gene_type:complete
MKKKIALIIFVLVASQIKAQKNITSITINGNAKTKKEVIIRELSFNTNTTYTQKDLQEKVETSKNNLINLKLFNFVEISSTDKNNNVEISINVIEKWYIWPYPILELSDRNFNSWWEEFSESNYSDFSRLNYGVFFNLENFRGRNELLKLKLRKGFKEHFLLEYQTPYFNKSKTLGLNLAFNLFRRKKTFYNTLNNQLIYYENQKKYTSEDYSIELKFKYRKAIHNTHNLKITAFNTLVSDSIVFKNPKYLNNNKSSGSYLRTSYEFTNDHRDYTIYPLNGHLIHLKLRKYNALTSPVNHLELLGRTEKHFTIKDVISIGSSFNFKLSSDEEQPYFAQKGFGFQEYVRGYEYYVIDGQNYWVSRTALKYALIKKYNFNIPYVKMKQFKKSHHSIYLGFFSDIGYICDDYNAITNPLQREILWGKGIALDYITYYDQILRIEYSTNHLGEKGVFLHFSNPFGSKN